MTPPRRRRRSSGNGQALGVVAALISMLVAAMYFLGPKVVTAASGGGSSGGGGAVASSDAGKILEQARKYDSLSYVYGGGHPPSGWGSGDGLDCSGMIDVAVLKVTGINENNTARDFRNSSHWSKISMSDAKTGDIVYLLKENHPGHSDDHVAIVVSNDGGKKKMTVFEAATWRTQQARQIRQETYSYDFYDGALRFHR